VWSSHTVFLIAISCRFFFLSQATVLARQKRQERFGTVIPDKDAEMKLKRAQRFGIVNDNVAKLARIARYSTRRVLEEFSY
jgi:hypothetical protein